MKKAAQITAQILGILLMIFSFVSHYFAWPIEPNLWRTAGEFVLGLVLAILGATTVAERLWSIMEKKLIKK
jgi:hypothetical protein